MSGAKIDPADPGASAPAEDDPPTAPDDPERDGAPPPDQTQGDDVPKVG